MARLIKSVKEIRQIQMDIVRYINRISRQNGLNCYMSGGSLLGAIRHKGYIPWDDDVDMMMMRSDYKKLITYINNDRNSPYKAMTYDTDSQYFYPFAKIVDTRTRVQEIVKVPIIDMGMAVDLFPIDDLPDSKRAIAFHFLLEKKLREIFDSLYVIGYNHKGVGRSYAWRRSLLRVIARLMNIIAMLYQSPKAKRVAVSIWGYGMKEVIAKTKMTKSKEVTFEREQVLAPRGYHTYLTHLYGDYMTPPPKAKQHNEHSMKVYAV